jgi:hypothetical protein
MTSAQVRQLRRLEGRRVSLSMFDGSYIRNALLVSACGGRSRTVWLDVDGIDVFIATSNIREGWEYRGVQPHPGSSRVA